MSKTDARVILGIIAGSIAFVTSVSIWPKSLLLMVAVAFVLCILYLIKKAI